MKKYKALFLDLDGTLVRHGPGNLPTKRVTDAINAAANVTHICFATGRILSGVHDIIDHLHLTGLCVISNGIQIYDPVKKQIIWDKKINKESLPLIYDIMIKHHADPRIFTGSDEFTFDGNFDRDDIYSMWADNIPLEVSENVVRELSAIPDINVHKMTAWRGDLYAVEATHAEASKLHGIVEVGKLLGIDTHEMIGVGDGYNDFPLLMACGLKIAMGNAVPELKAIADFIAPSVDEDGVATVIEKFILHE